MMKGMTKQSGVSYTYQNTECIWQNFLQSIMSDGDFVDDLFHEKFLCVKKSFSHTANVVVSTLSVKNNFFIIFFSLFYNLTI